MGSRGECGEYARRPVSRVLSPSRRMAIPLGTPVTECLLQPTRAAEPETGSVANDAPPLFGLAPGGVCRAAAVTGDAVRSYRTLSPLPARAGGLLSVALSLGSPPPGITRHRVSVEPGLSSDRTRPAAIRPSGTCGHRATWPGGQGSARRRAARRSRVRRSGSPSQRCGDQWRWKAATAARVASSSTPERGTA